MTPRDAVALALVGWYLISPPWNKIDRYGRRHPDPTAPIGQWYFEPNDPSSWETARNGAKIFASERECEKRIQEHDRRSFRAWKKRFDNHEHVPESIFQGLSSGDWEAQVSSEQCIARDDPRLKGN